MGAARWTTYLRERFPLGANAPLVAAFSASAVGFSALLREAPAGPTLQAGAVAFATSLLFFLQLRIADEFKDADADRRFRPYRPVPRGLVTLRELGWVAIGAAAVQAGLALALDPWLLVALVPVWGYLLLMTAEFFAPRVLRARPVLYMATHMLIVPLVDFYATACDWMAAGLSLPPAGLAWFLVVSFCNGLVIELGRKIRAPEREEIGVETYSALWGRTGASLAWLLALTAAGLCAFAAALPGPAKALLGLLLAGLLGASALTARRFAETPAPEDGRTFEALSWLWTVSMYVTLGVLPLLL